MLKSFKYCLYPNKPTAEKLQWIIDRCRELYNAALQERRDTWQIIKNSPNYYDLEWRKQATKEHSISLYDQYKEVPEVKESRPEYKNIPTVVIRDPLQRVHKAFQAFFKRVATGKTPGYPRFMSKSRYDSFTYIDNQSFHVDGSRLILSNIGSIRMRGSKKHPLTGTIKTLTIKREGDHWYASFACEVEAPEKLPVSYEDTGIDLGVTHFAALSNGEFIEPPKHYRKAEKKLKKLQEALSRKKRGSNRRKKAVQAVAKAHRKVRNQRKDFAHKASRQIANRYQVIALEDLKTANLVRRPKPKQDEETGQYLPNGASAKAGLNKSISDAGWNMFATYLSYKAEWAGRSLVFVNPKNTSQICSACHKKGPHKDLAERTHTCVHCGVVLDRDTNAAINILALGYKAQGTRP